MRNLVILSIAGFLLAGCKNDEASGDAAIAPDAKASEAGKKPDETTAPSASDSVRASQGNPLPVLPPGPAGAGYAPTEPESIAADLLDERAKNEADSGVLSATTQRHDQYMNEARQEDWASFVEGRLRAHFLNVRFSNLDVVELGCKTSVCEIVALTRDSSSTSSALDAWQQEVYSLPREDWWRTAQMRQPAFSVSTASGGRALFVTHLVRSMTPNKTKGTAP